MTEEERAGAAAATAGGPAVEIGIAFDTTQAAASIIGTSALSRRRACECPLAIVAQLQLLLQPLRLLLHPWLLSITD
jgi:hypothetical protein